MIFFFLDNLFKMIIISILFSINEVLYFYTFFFSYSWRGVRCLYIYIYIVKQALEFNIITTTPWIHKYYVMEKEYALVFKPRRWEYSYYSMNAFCHYLLITLINNYSKKNTLINNCLRILLIIHCKCWIHRILFKVSYGCYTVTSLF